MSSNVLSQDEWQAYFPHPPQKSIEAPFVGKNAHDLLLTRFAAVSVAVTVDTVWPGLGALDDQVRVGSIVFSIGRWFIDATAISRIDDRGGDYDIELDRVMETDWMTHMLGKKWLYDPTDFFDVLDMARHLCFPDQSQEWRDQLLWDEVQAMIRAGDQVIMPSRLHEGNRMYLVSRMNTHERDMFCAFLAQQKYVFDQG